MPINENQKRVIDSVLSIFETGRVPTPAAYSTCAILADGAGISYGKHQSTDRGGALDKIVDLYILREGKRAGDLRQFVEKLAANETARVDPKNPPSWAKHLMGILKDAGSDPIMQACQDEVFDSHYWVPALGHAQKIGLQTALGHLVVYDTCIHSGPGGVANIRSRFPEPAPCNGGSEKDWIVGYIRARRLWLSSSKNALVQRTVYRMDEFSKIVQAGNWDLDTPMSVRGVKIP